MAFDEMSQAILEKSRYTYHIDEWVVMNEIMIEMAFLDVIEEMERQARKGVICAS